MESWIIRFHNYFKRINELYARFILPQKVPFPRSAAFGCLPGLIFKGVSSGALVAALLALNSDVPKLFEVARRGGKLLLWLPAEVSDE